MYVSFFLFRHVLAHTLSALVSLAIDLFVYNCHTLWFHQIKLIDLLSRPSVYPSWSSRHDYSVTQCNCVKIALSVFAYSQCYNCVYF